LADPKTAGGSAPSGADRIKKRSPGFEVLVVNLISPDKRYDSVYMSNYALVATEGYLWHRLPGVGDIAGVRGPRLQHAVMA
jgi:multidrug efflux pump